jgi:hypothetical protein
MRETFVNRKFKNSSWELIDIANVIIAEYQEQGFTLTLRQLYYQFVSRDIIPNKQTEYKRLGSVINDARLAGLIDWDAIEDRTRNLRAHPSWDSPASVMRAVADQYQEDPWIRQENMVEVWIEKDALVGVIEPVCNRWRVPYFACRGYSSQSEQYRAGKRFKNAQRLGQKPIVLHLGDHDPSGMDMTRDNEERLSMFARCGVEVRRLALNWDQIQTYNPPPNPAKETDSRSEGYIAEFGHSSWELDALSPTIIDALVDKEISGLVDDHAWERAMWDEERNRNIINKLALNWDDVADYLSR